MLADPPRRDRSLRVHAERHREGSCLEKIMLSACERKTNAHISQRAASRGESKHHPWAKGSWAKHFKGKSVPCVSPCCCWSQALGGLKASRQTAKEASTAQNNASNFMWLRAPTQAKPEVKLKLQAK
jgi:hypothetical protein